MVSKQGNFTRISQYPFLFFYQHNNVSTKNWHRIKKELSDMKDIASSVVQNRRGKRVFSRGTLDLNNFFQGPTFIIGCKNINQVESIKILMQRESNFLFLGGFLFNQILSHSTLERILQGKASLRGGEERLKVYDSTRMEFIKFLEEKSTSIFFLQGYLNFNIQNLCKK